MLNTPSQKQPGPLLFIDKIYSILQNPQYFDTISWNSNGTIFTITDQECFCETVLPYHFKHKKIQSFVRQLNIYGFKKVKKQISGNSFKHPSFLKDSPGLLKSIKRRVKSRKFYLSADESEEERRVGGNRPVEEVRNDKTACERSEESKDGLEEVGSEQESKESVDCFFQYDNCFVENDIFTHRSITDWDFPFGHREY